MAQKRGEGDADGVLHQHVDAEEPEIVAKGVPELLGPDRIAKQGLEIVEPDKHADILHLAVKGKAQGVEERKDHHCRIDQHGRGEENDDVPAKAGGLHQDLRIRIMRRWPHQGAGRTCSKRLCEL